MARFVVDQTLNGSFIPSAYDSVNTEVNSAGNTQNGLRGTGTTTPYAVFYLVKGANAHTWVYYDFDCSSIPSDAVINSVSCKYRANAYSNTTGIMNSNYGQLSIGTEKVGTSAATFTTDVNTVRSITVSNHDFTREELDSIKLCLHSQRGTTASYTGSTSVNFKFYGAELVVNYSTGHYEYDVTVSTHTSAVTASTPVYSVTSGGSVNVEIQISNLSSVIAEDNYADITNSLTLVNGNTYRYTITGVNEDHNIVFDNGTINFPDENPNYNYYTVSVSSINAETTPSGTNRYQESTTQDIVIDPIDHTLVLAKDNGVDISSSIVPYQNIKNVSYSISNPGATHSFTLSNGWYGTSTITNSTNNTSAFARITFNLDVSCIITIQYYGQPASANDYIKISHVDTNLATYTGDTSANVRINTSSSAYTASNPASVVYNDVAAGTHTIDFKLQRGSSTSTSVSHKAYFRVEITPLEPITNYKYTLSNIRENHSIILVYGSANYHIISATASGNPILVPFGDYVCNDGENYKLVIIPSGTSQTATVTDNNTDVTQYVQRYETTENGITTVNFVYKLFNVNADHNISVTMGNSQPSSMFHIKQNRNWISVSKAYKKESGSWVEQSDLTSVFNTNKIYITRYE